MHEGVYFNRRDGGNFDVKELERWILDLPGGFRRRPAERVYVIGDDQKQREEWIPRLVVNPYAVWFTAVLVTEEQVWIQVAVTKKVEVQVRSLVLRLLDKYDCVISDGMVDVTAKVKKDVGCIFG